MKTDNSLLYLGIAFFGLAFIVCLFGIIFKGATHHIFTATIYGFLAWRCYATIKEEEQEATLKK